jgi:5-methylcytosine-specific restriction endonuclease McrA
MGDRCHMTSGDCHVMTPPSPRRGVTSRCHIERDRAYSSAWRRLVKEAIANGAWCVDCGAMRNLEGDHDLPVSRGGLSTQANLVIRYRACNRRKGNRVTRYQLRVPWPVPGRPLKSSDTLELSLGSSSARVQEA